MTIKELVDQLSKYPEQTRVYYNDVVYGCADVEMELTDIEESKLPETDELIILIH